LLRELIKNSLNRLGLDLRRYDDPYRLDIYEKLHPAEVLEKKPFYNIGSGSFHHPYWTCIDYDSDWYGKDREIIHYDLTALEPLPLKDDSAKIHYTSHTIEHVPDDAVQNLFNEVYRTLEKGGLFRITTGPDAETDWRALKNGDEDWFYWYKDYEKPGSWEEIYHQPPSVMPLEERWLAHVASQLAPNHKDDQGEKLSVEQIRTMMATMTMEDLLDDLCSRVRFNPTMPGNHVSWWTHSKIESFLKKAGFKTIYRSGFGQSASPLMRQSSLFDSTHPQISIYMEARK
jgi:predicted SAM-dependent methyltransferase